MSQTFALNILMTHSAFFYETLYNLVCGIESFFMLCTSLRVYEFADSMETTNLSYI